MFKLKGVQMALTHPCTWGCDINSVLDPQSARTRAITIVLHYPESLSTRAIFQSTRKGTLCRTDFPILAIYSLPFEWDYMFWPETHIRGTELLEGIWERAIKEELHYWSGKLCKPDSDSISHDVMAVWIKHDSWKLHSANSGVWGVAKFQDHEE